MRSKRAGVIALCGAVFLLHVAVLASVAYLYHANGADFQDRVELQDSGQYIILARSLLEGSGFTWEAGHPDSFRTPGYPLFIAAVFALSGGSFWMLALLNAFLAALITLPAYGIARELMFEHRPALALAGLLGVSPALLTQTVTGMGADILYTLLFATAGLLLLRMRQVYAYHASIGIGLILGFATLVRPVGLYTFPLVFIAMLFLAPDAEPWGVHMKKALAGAFVCLAVFAPWMFRNYTLFGHVALSSVPVFNIAEYNLPYFLAFRHGTTNADERASVMERLGNPTDIELRTFADSTSVKELAIATFKEEGIANYAIFHTLHTAPFFAGSGLNVMQAIVGQEAPQIANLSLAAPILIERLAWAVLFLLLFASPFLARGRTRVFFVFCVTLVLANAFLSSPVSQPRYRLPVEPFVLIAAAYAGRVLVERYRSARNVS
jgi:4-amino-4-deoxy-L-arabinose transferase-like glycosyltransferase